MKPRPGVMLRSPGSSKDSLPLLDVPLSPAQRLPGAGHLQWPQTLQRSQPLKCIVMLVLSAILLLNVLWLGQQSAPAWGQERLPGSPRTYTVMQRPSPKVRLCRRVYSELGCCSCASAQRLHCVVRQCFAFRSVQCSVFAGRSTATAAGRAATTGGARAQQQHVLTAWEGR